MHIKSTRRGFTLIELLVAVLIIGILAAVAVSQYKKAVLKTKMTQTFISGKAYLQAQRVYRLATGEYADANNAKKLDIQVLASGWETVWVGDGLQVKLPSERVQFDFRPAGGLYNEGSTRDAFLCIVYDDAPQIDTAREICQDLTGSKNGTYQSNSKRTLYGGQW